MENTWTPPSLWSAVWGLADAWSETPIVRSFAQTLPRNLPVEKRGAGATGVSAVLQELEVSVGGALRSPLLYGSRVPVVLTDPALTQFSETSVDDAEWKDWLQRAQRLQRAHQITLAWLRSGLSGYPMLRAPQLAAGTPFTTSEMTFEFIWNKEEFGSGLNLVPAPPGIANLLGADSASARALEAAARDLATQLRQSAAWLQFDEALKSLDGPAKNDLGSARRELKEQLVDDRLDEHEASLAMPRADFRVHTTAEIIGSLNGPARAYADAFADVHRLLTLTICDVFGELVVYGEPPSVETMNVETAVPGEPIIEFMTPGAVGVFLACGQILWLSDSPVRDAVRLEAKHMRFDLAHGTKDVLQARVLLGTADGWPAN